jgi:endonuclease G
LIFAAAKYAMKKIILSLVLAFLLFPGSSFATQDPPLPISSCSAEVLYGIISDKISNTSTVCRAAYILEHDNSAHIPVWVAYTLTPEHATGCLSRSNSFEADKSLPATAASTLNDYLKSGYDMGHQANDGDMRWSPTAETESFLLSNMAPQLPKFNRGIWKKLEDYTRGWAISRNHELQIYVGPIYSSTDKTIGHNSVIVPHGFWKIIIDTQTHEVLVFKFKHEGSNVGIDSFITNLTDLENETGLLFPLPEQPVLSTSLWPVLLKNAVSTKRSTCAIKQ